MNRIEGIDRLVYEMVDVSGRYRIAIS